MVSPSASAASARTASFGGAVGEALLHLGDGEVLGADLVEGREASAEDVVEAAEKVRFLELDDVAGLLDNAPERLVALRVGADGAERVEALRVEAAMAARMDFRARGGERSGEAFADLGVGVEEEQGVPLRAARADGGELAQGFDEGGEGGRVFGHIFNMSS